jgi:aspartyl protease family protein
MLRWYVLIVAAAVITASLLSRIPQVSSGGEDPDRVIMANATAIDVPANANSQASLNPLDRSIELTRQPNGYFYADVEINGAPVHMVVDTGATVIALSREDAQMARVPTDIGMNDVVGEGASGAVKGEQVVLDRVTLGDKTVERLPAIVLSNGGQSLLGQSFLSQFSSVHIEGDKMVLR